MTRRAECRVRCVMPPILPRGQALVGPGRTTDSRAGRARATGSPGALRVFPERVPGFCSNPSLSHP
ncbi:hypothetical protein STTU_4580 [Streptomyces sp. Tu6071]|nr:hypothetical protein STTU_4580 [Streptomyces sp. Tu6071]